MSTSFSPGSCAALNFAFVFGTIALFNSLLPVFAKNQAGVGEQTIGPLFLVNSLLIILLQLPIAKLSQGRRRMPSLALVAVLFACCWTLVALAGTRLPGTVILLVTAVAVLSVGECIYDSVYGPLVPDLAPAHVTGRYMAASGFSWQLGFIAGPAIGAALLGARPHALWPVVALFCLGAAAASLRTERALPEAARRVPRTALDSGRGPEDGHRSLRRRDGFDRARRATRP